MQQDDASGFSGMVVGIPAEQELQNPMAQKAPQQPTATTTPQMAQGGMVKKSRSHPLNKFYGK